MLSLERQVIPAATLERYGFQTEGKQILRFTIEMSRVLVKRSELTAEGDEDADLAEENITLSF